MSKRIKFQHEFECGPNYKGFAELDAGHDVVTINFEPTPLPDDIRFSTDIVVREKDTLEDVFVRYLNYLYIGNKSAWDALYESVNIVQNEYGEDEHGF